MKPSTSYRLCRGAGLATRESAAPVAEHQPGSGQHLLGKALYDTGRKEVCTARAGTAYGLAAYVWWGLSPVYYKAVAHVPVSEVLVHRIVWSALLVAFFVWVRGHGGAVIAAVSSRRHIATLTVSTAMLATSWFVFVWGIQNDCVLQVSLGYFLTPLVNVFLGLVFLGERLRKAQLVGVALATLGVIYLTVALGELPLIALVLALSFGVYGLIHKTVRVEPLVGLAVEVAMLLPFGLAYIAYLAAADELAFGAISRGTDVLLALAGVMTAVPLFCFGAAAQRLRLTTLGFLLYVTPSMCFVLSVAAFGETFGRTDLISFVCIWTALIIYSIDAARASRAHPRQERGVHRSSDDSTLRSDVAGDIV